MQKDGPAQVTADIPAAATRVVPKPTSGRIPVPPADAWDAPETTIAATAAPAAQLLRKVHELLPSGTVFGQAFSYLGAHAFGLRMMGLLEDLKRLLP